MFVFFIAGKCRRRAKDKEQSSTRRQWFENFKEFKGCSKALAQSKDGRIMALGMLSGYVFLFDVVTAYPAGEKLPITKHAAPVRENINTLRIWCRLLILSIEYIFVALKSIKLLTDTFKKLFMYTVRNVNQIQDLHYTQFNTSTVIVIHQFS